MIKHTQLKSNSCFATCIACILGLPLEAVPNFRQLQDEKPSYCMIIEADKWLRANHSKRLISIELYVSGELSQDVMVLNRLFCGEDLLILSGVSPRKNFDGTNRHHAVVGRADCWGFDIIHDPHPEGGGLVGMPHGIKWIVPVS